MHTSHMDREYAKLLMSTSTIVPLDQKDNTNIQIMQNNSISTQCCNGKKDVETYMQEDKNMSRNTSKIALSSNVSECSCDTSDTSSVMTDSFSSFVNVGEELELQQEARETAKTKKSTVQFSTVEIREYQRCIGDSPAVIGGPPISMTREYQNEVTYDLQEYEEVILQGRERRREDDLIIPRHSRESMLHDAGYSREEITLTIREVNITRDERRHTVETLFLAGIEEWCENLREALIGNPLRALSYNILRNNKTIQHLKQCEELSSCCNK